MITHSVNMLGYIFFHDKRKQLLFLSIFLGISGVCRSDCAGIERNSGHADFHTSGGAEISIQGKSPSRYERGAAPGRGSAPSAPSTSFEIIWSDWPPFQKKIHVPVLMPQFTLKEFTNSDQDTFEVGSFSTSYFYVINKN